MYKLLSMVLAISIGAEIAACEPIADLGQQTKHIATKRRKVKVRKVKKQSVPDVDIAAESVLFLNLSDIRLILDTQYYDPNLSDTQKKLIAQCIMKEKELYASIPCWACNRKKRIERELFNYALHEMKEFPSSRPDHYGQSIEELDSIEDFVIALNLEIEMRQKMKAAAQAAIPSYVWGPWRGRMLKKNFEDAYLPYLTSAK